MDPLPEIFAGTLGLVFVIVAVIAVAYGARGFRGLARRLRVMRLILHFALFCLPLVGDAALYFPVAIPGRCRSSSPARIRSIRGCGVRRPWCGRDS